MEEGIVRTSAVVVFVVSCISAGGPGCSKTKKADSNDTKASASLQPATKTGNADKPSDNPQTGSITGRAVFNGIKPERIKLRGRPDPGCPGRPATSDDVVINDNKTLRDVLVRIAPGSIKSASSAANPVVLEQKDCTYSPKVAGALVGATLRIHNSDRTAHDARIVKGDKTLFERTLAAGADDLVKTDLTPETGVLTVQSTTHPWMTAFVAVNDNPYFQTTGADGTVRIDGVPPGKYTVEAWHPKYGTRTISIQVDAGRATDVAFGFDATVSN
jgi:plastocyanin